MYKIQLYCSGCRKVIDDRQYNHSHILTLEKLNYGPWLDIQTPLNGIVEFKVGICNDCFKKIDGALNGNLTKALNANAFNYINEDERMINELYNKI